MERETCYRDPPPFNVHPLDAGDDALCMGTVRQLVMIDCTRVVQLNLAAVNTLRSCLFCENGQSDNPSAWTPIFFFQSTNWRLRGKRAELNKSGTVLGAAAIASNPESVSAMLMFVIALALALALAMAAAAAAAALARCFAFLALVLGLAIACAAFSCARAKAFS